MFKSLDQQVGNTRLVKLQRLGADQKNNTYLLKLEGDNPAGSVKDRPALSMIKKAQERGQIKQGDTLIEATSGNTGIALAMTAAIMGYKMRLIMAENMSRERMQLMRAYGAQLVLVSKEEGIEYARDLALEMQAKGEGLVLDQFSNADNPNAHYETTGPEIWKDTGGKITHFVSAMGTTGTIMGVSRYLKEQSADIKIVGVQPDDESSIPGIRRWPKAYLPSIFEAERVDQIIDVSQAESEEMARILATQEGVCAGVSSGGALKAALKLGEDLENAVIVSIVCDRGDRYLSTDLYDASV
jgi:cysteine synthase B